MMNEDKNKMHPDDMRNLVVFVVVALGLWLLVDTTILQPRMEKLEQHQIQMQKAAKEAVKIAAETGELGGIPVNPDGTAINRPRAEIINDSARITLNTPLVQGSIALKGGRIDDVSLNEYFKTMDKREEMDLFSPIGAEYPRFAGFGWAASDDNIQMPTAQTMWRVQDNKTTLGAGETVTLFWENAQGLRFERDISVDDQYMFTVTQRVLNQSSRSITLYPFSMISQRGKPEDLYGRWIVHEGLIGYIDGELTELNYKKIVDTGTRKLNADKGWIALTEHYWFTGIFPGSEQDNQFSFQHKPASLPGVPDTYQIDVLGAGQTLAPGQSGENMSHVYVGPKKLSILNEYGKALDIDHIDLALDFGVFYFLTRPIFTVLHFFGDLVGNFGVAIIMLTVLVRLLVFPLANTSFKSFAGLRKIAPKMSALREKHKDDREALQKELVKLYEREKVNPMAGCMPILIQIPIFFALFKVLQVSIEMRHAPFFGWIQDLSAPDPTSVFNLFGLIPWSPPAFLMIGIWPCLMLIFMILQKKMNPPPTDNVQKFMMDAMPFFITYILAKFPSGLVLYWTFSNALSVLQQYVIMKSMGVEPELFKSKKQKEEERKMREAGVNPAAEVVEEQIEKAMFGDETTLEKAEREEKAAPKISKPKPKKSKKKK
jgi:YidC/Oxa1 family membrane protein insertase